MRRPLDEGALEQRFLARVDAEEKIEPKDWMPARYRNTLIRQISQHAHSEIVGMLPEGNWITRAPTLKRKSILIAKVQDEGGHGAYLYSAAETLGVSRDQLVEQLLSGKAKYSSIFNYPTPTWADVGAIGWLVDGAAIMNQIPLCRCSYGPYARAMVRVCREESFHQRQGYDLMLHLAQGTRGAEAHGAGGAEPLVVAGAHDVRPLGRAIRRTAASRSAGRSSASRMTSCGRNSSISRCRRPNFSGSPCPIRCCAGTRSKQQHEFGPIDWTEFDQVLKGNGPCNAERLAARRNAHAAGAWVREAASALRRETAPARRKLRGLQPLIVSAIDEHTHAKISASGPCTKCSSARAAASITSMSAACTPPMRAWRSIMRATSTRAARRA